MNILSIDFDIIMYPCIKLYNDKVGGKENPTLLWNNLTNYYNIGQNLFYDAKTLHDISLLMIQAIQKGAKFIPITNHEEIIDYLKTQNLLNTENPISLTNIDFHHDIYYNDESILATKYFNDYNCANWIGYLLIQKYLADLIWYKAPNSDLCQINSVDELFQDRISIKSIQNLNDVNSQNYDYVFFCLSPQWIPYHFTHLFTLLCDIFNEV